MFVIPAPSSVAFSVCNIPIYWYGILMAIAILTSVLVGNLYLNLNRNGEKKDIILEYSPLTIVSGIVGARIYYCALNFDYYSNNILEIFDIRQGGLSIHGALFGGVVCLIVLCCKNRINPMRILDVLSTTTVFGQAIGRWGNYFNSEAYGFPVLNQDWGLFIPVDRRISEYIDYSLYHPTFLYESVLDLGAFFILTYLYFRFNKKFVGLNFYVYLILYSIIRFGIEQIRVDSALNIGEVPIAQIISVVMFFIGVVGGCYSLRASK